MHFFSIDQKIWHFFIKISQYFKGRLGLAERALGAAELQVNLLFDHLQCTIDVLFGYFILSPEGGAMYQNRIKIEASKTHYRAHATSLIFCYIRSFFKAFGGKSLRCLAKNR